MHSPNTNRAPADNAQAQAIPAAVPSPAVEPEARDAATDAQHSVEYWYFCGDGAAMRIA
jgi:hypothetical protein